MISREDGGNRNRMKKSKGVIFLDKQFVQVHPYVIFKKVVFAPYLLSK